MILSRTARAGAILPPGTVEVSMSARTLLLALVAAAAPACAVCDCVADSVQLSFVDLDGEVTTWTSFTVLDDAGNEVASDTCPEGSACRTAFVPMDGEEGSYTVSVSGPAGAGTLQVDLQRPTKVIGQCCSDVFFEERSLALTPTE